MRVRPRALGIYIKGVQFNEPQNPFPQGLSGYVRGIQFNEPQNPFPASSPGGLGCLGCLGQAPAPTSGFDLSSIGTSLSDAWTQLQTYEVAGIPVVYLAAGVAAVLLVMSMSSGPEALQRRAGRYSARARVLQAKAALKEQYPGIIARARRRLQPAT